MIVPVDDMRELGTGAPPPRWTISPASGAASADALDLARDVPRAAGAGRAHRSTLIFVNNRRLAERLAAAPQRAGRRGGRPRPPRQPGPRAARPHRGGAQGRAAAGARGDQQPGARDRHGRGRPGHPGREPAQRRRACSASAARGTRSTPRAGAHLPEVPGRPAGVRGGGVAHAAGAIEETRVPRLPLDVLAQQIVAMGAVETLTVDEIEQVARGAPPLRRAVARAARGGARHARRAAIRPTSSPSCGPRVVWDRAAGTVRGREGARSLAVQNAGTIPDRGLFAVVLPDGGAGGRARRGDGLRGPRWPDLHARCVDLAHRGDHPRPRDRHPGAGRAGALPFWKGEGIGRPYELGEAVGRLARELVAAGPEPAAARLRRESAFEDRAAGNLVGYLEDQAAATGVVPSDRAVVVERFRDEIGDWRLCVLTPFGAGSTRPGRWPGRRGCGRRRVRRPTPSGATTASPSTCPTRTRRPRPTSP